MHGAAIVVLLMVFSFLNSGCGFRITSEEAKMLVVLDEIQRGMESNISFEQFEQLLETARAELKILEQSSAQNPCFMGAVKKAYASYEIAKKAWIRKEAARDKRRKADMEMTMSFSLSFSVLNIKKANNCYK